MKFNNSKTILWYALLQSVSVGACTHAFGYLAASFAITVIYFIIAIISLTLSTSEKANKNRFEKFSEAIAITGMILFLPLIMFSKLLIALMTFIMFALLALNLQTDNYRRFYLGVIVSFVIICVGAVESKSGTYLFWLTLFATSLALSLSAAHFAQSNSGKNTCWHARDYWHICGIALILSFIIYLLLPRFPAGNLGASPGSEHFYRDKQWETEASNKSQSYEDQLNQLNKLDHTTHSTQDNTASEKPQERSKENKHSGQKGDGHKSNQPNTEDGFSYEGFQEHLDINNTNSSHQEEGGIPPNLLLAYVRSDQPLYLRAKTFDYFDQNRWSRHYDTSSKIEIPFGGLKLNSALTNAKIISYEVEIETNLGDYIALSAVPTHLNFPSIAIEIDSYGQFKAPNLLRAGTKYAATSAIYIRDQSVFAEQNLPADEGHFLQLPNLLDNRVAALAQSITDPHTNLLDKAIGLEQHLRAHYEYSVDSIYQSQGVTPLSDFLFEAKSGHCEYFASALAIMLRTIGIPSRLVTGFSATSQNPLTGYYEIYALDAHAWVEAYIDNLGWLILEPTPFYDGPIPEKTKLSAEKIDNYVERLEEIKKMTNQQGEPDFNLENIMISLWIQMKYLAVISLSYLKLFILNYWIQGLFILMLGMSGCLAWQYSKPHRLTRRILAKAYKAKNLDSDYRLQVYIECIEELFSVRMASRHNPLTIEKWLNQFQNIEMPTTKMSRYFNDTKYHSHSNLNAISDYEKLVFALANSKSSEVNSILLRSNRRQH